jgi:hypothetical protein
MHIQKEYCKDERCGCKPSKSGEKAKTNFVDPLAEVMIFWVMYFIMVKQIFHNVGSIGIKGHSFGCRFQIGKSL